MPEFMKNDGTPSQNETRRAELTAFAQKHHVDMSQFGAGQQPAPPAGTPAEVAALEQGLSKAPTIHTMAAQASKQVADQLVASQIYIAEQKNGSPLSFTEKQALEIQLRAKVGRALAIDGHSAPAAPIDPELLQLHRATGVPLNTSPETYAGLDFGSTLAGKNTDHRLHAQETFAAVASKIGLDQHVASSLASHLGDLQQSFAQLDADGKAKWSERQTKTLLAACNGDPAKAAAMTARAHAILNSVGPVRGRLGTEDFAKNLAGSLAGGSAFIIRTINASADALELLERGKKQL